MPQRRNNARRRKPWDYMVQLRLGPHSTSNFIVIDNWSLLLSGNRPTDLLGPIAAALLSYEFLWYTHEHLSEHWCCSTGAELSGYAVHPIDTQQQPERNKCLFHRCPSVFLYQIQQSIWYSRTPPSIAVSSVSSGGHKLICVNVFTIYSRVAVTLLWCPVTEGEPVIICCLPECCEKARGRLVSHTAPCPCGRL